MKRRHFGKAGSAQRGAVALVLGLTLAVLIGFAGLALDLGRFFVNKSELQNAMDACALAAATQLRPGLDNPLALTQAVAYGRVFATGGTGNIEAIKNRINFQSQTVDPDLLQITFAEALDGTYLDSSAANYNTAKYARCTYALSGLPVLFMRVLNPGRPAPRWAPWPPPRWRRRPRPAPFRSACAAARARAARTRTTTT